MLYRRLGVSDCTLHSWTWCCGVCRRHSRWAQCRRSNRWWPVPRWQQLVCHKQVGRSAGVGCLRCCLGLNSCWVAKKTRKYVIFMRFIVTIWCSGNTKGCPNHMPVGAYRNLYCFQRCEVTHSLRTHHISTRAGNKLWFSPHYHYPPPASSWATSCWRLWTQSSEGCWGCRGRWWPNLQQQNSHTKHHQRGRPCVNCVLNKPMHACVCAVSDLQLPGSIAGRLSRGWHLVWRTPDWPADQGQELKGKKRILKNHSICFLTDWIVLPWNKNTQSLVTFTIEPTIIEKTLIIV